MSLKILKQQLQDIVIQDESKEKESRKKQKQHTYQEAKFTRTRKVMKKNLKPKTQVDSIETNVSRIKEGIMFFEKLIWQKQPMQEKKKKQIKNGI